MGQQTWMKSMHEWLLKLPFTKKIVSFHHTFFYSYPLITGFFFLVLYIITSTFPLLTKEYTLSIQGFQINSTNMSNAILEANYVRLLLVTVFISISPFLHLLLDSWNIFDVSLSPAVMLFRQEFFSYLLLLASIVLPNIIIFVKFRASSAETVSDDSLFIFLAMRKVQQASLLYGFLMIFFNHSLKFSRYTDSPLVKFPFSIEKRSVNIMFLIFCSGILSALNGKSSERFSFFGITSILLFVVSILLSLSIILRVFVIIFKQLTAENFSFRSHHHLSEFLYAALCIAYIVSFGILNITAALQHGLKKGEDNLYRYFTSIVVVEIVLICLLNVIPEVRTKKLAASKHDQLETRLNLIRYVSHEMRTPLNTVSMGMSILKEEIQSKMLKTRENCNDMLDTVHHINNSCNVAISTLDDLLTFDKIDENKLVIEMEEINPWTLLQDTARPFNLNALIKKIQFQVQLLTEVSYQSGMKEGNTESLERMFEKYCIRGDSFKLAQVIRNLLSNALKFTPESGKVDVSLVLVEEESHLNTSSHHHKGPMIQFIVKDTGAGISKANMSKLFGQYIQFNASQLQKGKGSGLGLWISKSIVEMHGGTVVANSEGEGFGTEFIVEIPLKKRAVLKRSLAHLEINKPPLFQSASRLFVDELQPVKEERELSDRSKDIESQQQTSSISVAATNSLNQLPTDVENKAAELSWWSKLASYLTPDNRRVYVGDASTDDIEKNLFSRRLSISGSLSSKRMSVKERTGQFLNFPVRLLSRSFQAKVPDQDKESLSPEKGFNKLRRSSSTLFNSSSIEDSEIDDTRTVTTFIGNSHKGIAFPECNAFTDGSIDYQELEENKKSELNPWDSGLTILLVDDSDSNRKMCRRILSLPATPKSTISSASAPHRILEAKDGLDCLRVYDETISSPSLPLAAGQKSIDLVLMDDNMPGMLGYEAAKALRDRGYKGVIIGVTGDLYQETIDRFVNNGANEVMGKPLNISRLKERYSELVSK